MESKLTLILCAHFGIRGNGIGGRPVLFHLLSQNGVSGILHGIVQFVPLLLLLISNVPTLSLWDQLLSTRHDMETCNCFPLLEDDNVDLSACSFIVRSWFASFFVKIELVWLVMTFQYHHKQMHCLC